MISASGAAEVQLLSCFELLTCFAACGAALSGAIGCCGFASHTRGHLLPVGDCSKPSFDERQFGQDVAARIYNPAHIPTLLGSRHSSREALLGGDNRFQVEERMDVIWLGGDTRNCVRQKIESRNCWSDRKSRSLQHFRPANCTPKSVYICNTRFSRHT